MRVVDLLVFSTAILTACTNPLAPKPSIAPDFHPGVNTNIRPTVSGILPAMGPLLGGTAVTITGTSFETNATVTIGGASCTGVVRVSVTQLTCTTSGHAAGVTDVVVTNPSAPGTTLASAFAYVGSANSTPQFAVTSGGGISTGAGLRLRGTASIVGNPIIQSGAGTAAVTGVQGTFSRP